MTRYWIALLALVVLLIPVWVFDRPLFSFINGAHSAWSDPFWLALTTAGDGLILAVVAGAFLVVNPRIAVLGLAVLVFCALTVSSIKLLVPTIRPAGMLDSVHVIGPLLRSGSFPSGHAAAGMGLALAIAHLSSSRVVGGLALAMAVLVALSRVFVGAHFPRDVLGGTFVALAVFIAFVLLIWPRIEAKIPEKPDWSLKWLRRMLIAEVVATLYALCVHAPLAAESPPVAAAVAVAILIFVVAKMLTGMKSRTPRGP